MAVYKHTQPGGTPELRLEEMHIYGSSRLGMTSVRNNEMITAANPTDDGLFTRTIGETKYELSNHLGNVLSVITDLKIAHDNGGVLGHYTAQAISYTDYYPFGSPMDNVNNSANDRDWQTNYRYTFQKQEVDNELWNGSVVYRYRIEDSRLGRFFSVDPLHRKYAYYSSYQFSGNRVIDAFELEGLEPASVNLTSQNQRSLRKFDRKEAKLAQRLGLVQGSTASYDAMEQNYGNKRWFWSKPESGGATDSKGFSKATDSQAYYSARDLADYRNLLTAPPAPAPVPAMVAVPLGNWNARINPTTGTSEFSINIAASGVVNIQVTLSAPGATANVQLFQDNVQWGTTTPVNPAGGDNFGTGTSTTANYPVNIPNGTWLTLQRTSNLAGGDATYTVNSNAIIIPPPPRAVAPIPKVTFLPGDGQWGKTQRLTKSKLGMLQQIAISN